MGQSHDAMMMVRARIIDEIDALECLRAPAPQIAGQVEALRRVARDHQLGAVEAIAHHLECALAKSGGVNTVRPYLGALRDAVRCGRADAATVATLLAPVSQQLMG